MVRIGGRTGSGGSSELSELPEEGRRSRARVAAERMGRV